MISTALAWLLLTSGAKRGKMEVILDQKICGRCGKEFSGGDEVCCSGCKDDIMLAIGSASILKEVFMIGKKVGVRIGMRRGMSAFAGMLALLGMFVSLFAIQEAAVAANPVTEIAYPVKDFRNGDARFYKYPAGDGVTIKYFVLKSSDGVIRAAFDACDVCWREGKGYTQKGDFMVCNNCGRRFASVRVNEVTGGCNPSPLTREIRGDKVVLQAKDILAGKPYFTFGKGGGK